MRSGQRLLVQWRDREGEVEPWLDFSTGKAGEVALKMAKIDPAADFSSDFEDLDFTRSGSCPSHSASTTTS